MHCWKSFAKLAFATIVLHKTFCHVDYNAEILEYFCKIFVNGNESTDQQVGINCD